MSASRRRFLRSLGLAPIAAIACKIEPILDLPPPPEPVLMAFPDLPPRIPEQLENAEDMLTAALDAFLDREGPYLAGELRQRSPENPRTTEHLVALLRVFGLEPAGPRGDWLQPIELRLVEQPNDVAPIVRMRRNDASGQAPAEGDDASTIDLIQHGGFRQRRAGRVDALLLAAIREFGEPLPREAVAGRVVLLRAPSDLDFASEALFDRLDALAALARQSGAAGCLLLAACSDEALDPLRERWRRQFRLTETSEADELVIEGVLSATGSELLATALADEEAWVLDADLGLRERTVTSHNVAGRLAGRELPGEAAVLLCAWDTPFGYDGRIETLRLLASLATVAQLAEWQRRGSRPRRSILVLFAVDAGLGAGQLGHARWTATAGVQPTAVLAFDRVDPDIVHPAVLLSGHFDARVTELAERGVRRDGRDLLLGNELTLPSLAPYLRAPIPVMTIGAPPDAAAGAGGDPPRSGLHAEVRLVRNLLLALAERLAAPASG
jgi:hypothetical protein